MEGIFFYAFNGQLAGRKHGVMKGPGVGGYGMYSSLPAGSELGSL